MNSNYIIQRPVVTEESTIQTETHNQYIFRVDPKANKAQIREAVERMFHVKVLAVNTMNYEGKWGTRRARGVRGRRPSWKKAIVTVRSGDKIELL
ncbi:MAG: 50S ribosomal protein L23 [Candidatus Hydrogenedentes bacterium]|nr:50S ribosomal protein L23 [Candidatus Hydrogenedentota bacterium]